MKLRLSVALMFTLLPMLAYAKPRSSGGRMRPQLFHDRAPKPHMRSFSPRVGR